MTEPVLEVCDLAVAYRGGGVGVAGVSFTVGDAEVVALVGPNGAGKTSTLRGVTGTLRRDPARAVGGRVVFQGRDVRRLGPRERAGRGLVMVPEEHKVFPGLTVAEHLRLAGRAAGRDAAGAHEEALDVFPALRSHLDRKAGLLSGGQRQMLAVASALCMRPSLLVVDELTLGLSPELVETMIEALRQVVAGGLPMVIAEQNVTAANALAANVVVFNAGRVIGRGDPNTAAGQERLREAFLGAAPNVGEPAR
jgi:branched-chain amino acid transport system ATP-binding protein